jgi:CBS-domain-containing membrane protein
LAIGVLAYSELEIPNTMLLMAPFGATAVLVFGIPDSPLAQPKNVIFGHLITPALIGAVVIVLLGKSMSKLQSQFG